MYKIVVVSILSIFLCSCSVTRGIFGVDGKETVSADNKSNPNIHSGTNETPPSFPGGIDAYVRFLSEHLRYPTLAKYHSIEGKVLLEIVVTPSGTIQDIKIIDRLGYGCDEEAIRVIKLMPNWVPGRKNGKPVFVKVLVPIEFRLAN